jgi:cell division protein FtsL
MKGFMQLQTIIYVVFAVMILMVGIFSVESYLTNLKVDANYELDEMDLTIIGKRITSSCYTDINFIQDFSVVDFGYKGKT